MKYFNRAAETMPRSELHALQSERLKALVKRVYENVQHYRAKMDAVKLKPSDIKSIDDLHKLPYTTKADLRANYPFGLFAVPKRDIVRIHASSGTTGKLTVVGYTQNDIRDWAEGCARALVMAGMDENSVVHVSYGYGLFTGGLGAHYGAELLGATAVPVSAGNTPRQLMLLKDFGADCICCTPSYAIYLAEELAKAGISKSELNLKAGLFGAEPWSEAMRKQIEAGFGIKAYDIYGLSEICGPGVGAECVTQSGTHIAEDMYYPEIVDTDTLEPLGYNKKGEIVFTTLTKEGIPLIRYRTRDITSLDDGVCACGRTHVRMARIEGRSDDMLIIRGVNVFPSQIETVLLSAGDAIGPHYRIVVDRADNLDTIEIQVELTEKAFGDTVKSIEKIKARLAGDMQSHLSVSAKITIMEPNSIPRSEGKAVRIIDNRKY
ncbi:MAG: phenylacetate--CoA ligase [Clostridiaceae bacterium]|jgi:phenylacetate-CoA ligase|nr:phenylacetate--CoA ligase [Clostridiaceae bacterium]